MASNNDSRVYMGVVNDVIGKVRDEFINCGAGEALLSEIRSLWEMKMMQMQIGASSSSSSSSRQATLGQVNPVHAFRQTPAEHELRAPTPPAAVGTPTPTNHVSADDGDGDGDDDDSGSNSDEEEPTAQHLVLAQFVKVTRTKKTKKNPITKWKCTLKDGIILLNNRDILFNEAMGEFDFYKLIDEIEIE